MLTKSEIIEILSDNSEENNKKLFQKADNIRKENVGDEVHLRGLIEFSNICRCNCKYCGLRSSNNEIERYRIEKEKVIEMIHLGILNDAKSIAGIVRAFRL